MRSTNLALMRSEVPNHRYRFTIRDEVFSFTFDNGGIFNNDIRNLSNNATARSLRDQYRADIVVLLTNQQYNSIAGIARKILAENDSAYVIAEVPFIVGPRWTLSHEIAHLSGARHDRGTGSGYDNTDICNHGFVFEDKDQNSQRTIMARLFTTENASRINQFSNPLVEFNEAPTGDEDNNNAIALYTSKCEVQSFRASPFWSIFIGSSPAICPNENNQLCATVLAPATSYPGVGPYTYTWNYNFTGIFSSSNPGTSLGTDICETLFILGPISVPYVYVRLKVVSNDNQELITVKAIRIKHDNCPPDPFSQPIYTGPIDVNNETQVEQDIDIIDNERILNNEKIKYLNIKLFDHIGRVYFNCNDCFLEELLRVLDYNRSTLPRLLLYTAKSEKELIVNSILNIEQ